jgi:hypothetical protein
MIMNELERFFCLVTIENRNGFQSQIRIVVSAEDESDAEIEVERVLQSWEEPPEFFTVEQISTSKMYLKRFIVHTLDSRNHRKPVREFTLQAVDQKTAETLAAGTISKWTDGKYIQIIKVWQHEKV